MEVQVPHVPPGAEPTRVSQLAHQTIEDASKIADDIVRERTEQRLKFILIALKITVGVLWLVPALLLFYFGERLLLTEVSFFIGGSVMAVCLLYGKKWIPQLSMQIERNIRNELNWI